MSTPTEPNSADRALALRQERERLDIQIERDCRKLVSRNCLAFETISGRARANELESERDSLAALVVRMREALASIEEYWNGSNGAAPDAAEYSRNTATQALSLVPESLADCVVVKRGEWEAIALYDHEPRIHSHIEDCLPESHPLAFKQISCDSKKPDGSWLHDELLHAANNECMQTWVETGVGNFCWACAFKRIENVMRGDLALRPEAKGGAK